MSYPLDDPGINKLLDIVAPLGQGRFKRKERELNPQGSSLGRFRDGCHRPLACPSVVAAAAGIEPAIVSLTGSRLTIGPHRKKVRTVGFEPTLSGSQNRRIPRLSYVLSQSTQRESNPHVLHGEQARCRYITGASGIRGTRTLTWLVKSQVCCANTWIPFRPGGSRTLGWPF